MAASNQSTITLVSLILFQYLSGSYSMTFTIVNNCNHIVWSGILSEDGTTLFSTIGFPLRPGESNALAIPPKWSDHLWGRTLCSRNSTRKFSCVTGDYASSVIECAGRNAQSPAKLTEFTLNGTCRFDFFDVSLVGVYKLLLSEPHGAIFGGKYSATCCMVDFNVASPSGSKVMSNDTGKACKSASEAFGYLEYCCSGAYASPDTCKPSSYTPFYKSVCPHAYNYSIIFTFPTSLIE